MEGNKYFQSPHKRIHSLLSASYKLKIFSWCLDTASSWGRQRAGEWRWRRRRWRKDAIKRRENNFTEHHRDVHVERLQCRCSNDMAGGVSEGCSWWCRKVARIEKSIIKIGFGCVVRHNNSIWQKAFCRTEEGTLLRCCFTFLFRFYFIPKQKQFEAFDFFFVSSRVVFNSQIARRKVSAFCED